MEGGRKGKEEILGSKKGRKGGRKSREVSKERELAGNRGKRMEVGRGGRKKYREGEREGRKEGRENSES